MDSMEKNEEASAPVLCSNGCGFFGNPLTGNMCSKCYSDQKSQVEDVSSPAVKSQEQESKIEEPKLMEVEEEQKPELPEQTDKTKCFSCSKKVGFSCGLPCKCGYIFCARHRYPDQHNCSFDHKTAGRETLRKLNPLVAGNKINAL